MRRVMKSSKHVCCQSLSPMRGRAGAGMRSRGRSAPSAYMTWRVAAPVLCSRTVIPCTAPQGVPGWHAKGKSIRSARRCRAATLDGERRPATAGALRVGVLDHELRAFEAFLVVGLGAGEVLVAHRVDQQHDARLLHYGVVLVLHLVEGEAVLEARQAAPGHEHPELEPGVAFLLDALLDLVRRAVAE